jgi:hypothetical protein
MTKQIQDDYWHSEPVLADLLADELTELVMRRDGVDRAKLLALIARQQQAIRTQGIDAAA